MSNVVICVGVPASGKSTWARAYAERTGALVVCRDDVRLELVLKHGDDEILVTDLAHGKIEEALTCGFDVVVADTNINRANRNALIKFCTERGATVTLKVFPISLEEALKRDRNRNASVGEEVITRMYNQLKSQHLTVR